MSSKEKRAIEQLAALLGAKVGLKIGSDGHHALRLALAARMPAVGAEDPLAYVSSLEGKAGEQELRSLLPLVTIGHTEFFRDTRQFEALERDLLPAELARARREGRRLHLWSAGCATGEEPYSLAIALLELGATPEEVNLWATDLNPKAIEAAREGYFTPKRLQGIAPGRLRRFFEKGERGTRVIRTVRELVRFDTHNLASSDFALESGALDLILCRNVIIYFDLPTIRALMDRFLEALRPGGFLLLGYSESLFKLYERFEMVEVGGAFVYTRPSSPGGARPLRPLPGDGAAALGLSAVAPGSRSPAPGGEGAASPDVVGEAPGRAVAEVLGRADRGAAGSAAGDAPGRADRGAAGVGSREPLARGSDEERRRPVPFGDAPVGGGEHRNDARGLSMPNAPGTPPRGALTSSAEGARARLAASASADAERTFHGDSELLAVIAREMEAGDFEQALKLAEEIGRAGPTPLEVRLTLGNLYSLSGRTDDALGEFAAVLDDEPLCADARLLAGAALLQAGRLAEARAELAKALFLEPTLGLGHYLSAQVLERLGDERSARRAYRNAVAQLRRPQRPLIGHYPDLEPSGEALEEAARHALAALEELPR